MLEAGLPMEATDEEFLKFWKENEKIAVAAFTSAYSAKTEAEAEAEADRLAAEAKVETDRLAAEEKAKPKTVKTGK